MNELQKPSPLIALTPHNYESRNLIRLFLCQFSISKTQSLTQLNSGSNFKYIEAYKTFVNLKNGESESVKINIDTPGVYLLNFSVCHCGGSSITSNDPSWSVKAPFNFFLARKTLAIPIAKRWDDISGTATFIKYLDKGEYTFNFINETGTSTSDTYYSTVFVSGIMVK